MLSVVMLSVVMLSVVMLSVVMLSVIMISVAYKPIMLSVVMPNVVVLSLVAPCRGVMRGAPLERAPAYPTATVTLGELSTFFCRIGHVDAMGSFWGRLLCVFVTNFARVNGALK
jgi:hypothetical protein